MEVVFLHLGALTRLSLSSAIHGSLDLLWAFGNSAFGLVHML